MKHLGAIIKSDVMVRHGGILLDTDAIFARALDPDLFYYEAVVSPQLKLTYLA